MCIGFDHFSKIVRGAGERESVFGSESAGCLGAMKGLFVATNKQRESAKMIGEREKKRK